MLRAAQSRERPGAFRGVVPVAFGAASVVLAACGLLADTTDGPRLPEDRDAAPASGASGASSAPPPVLPDARPSAPIASDGASAPQCAALGGKCVAGKWANCPAGTEPADDIHADCMPAGASRGYFCCVPAPPSPCADDVGSRDCFAHGCESCWIETDQAPSSCSAGRTCCAYACPD